MCVLKVQLKQYEVYSFGVLFLEIITGRPAVNHLQQSAVIWVNHFPKMWYIILSKLHSIRGLSTLYFLVYHRQNLSTKSPFYSFIFHTLNVLVQNMLIDTHCCWINGCTAEVMG
ncbi:hypothetical protein E2542_SST13740 [Spatholobus suberectus]|nr:hypothetical protein E2542_SST13740 [Spatholobus suberectus]